MEHFTGTITYDADTEVPTNESGTSQVLVIVQDPTKNDIFNSAGKITLGTKKIIFNEDVTVTNGDKLTMDSDNEIYQMIEVINYRTRTVAFADKVRE